jgi:predicted DNA-binding protein (UPF0251 family)
MTLHPQFITDENGKQLSVILSLEEYETVLNRLEDFQDIEDARAVKDEPTVSWETFKAELELEV